MLTQRTQETSDFAYPRLDLIGKQIEVKGRQGYYRTTIIDAGSMTGGDVIQIYTAEGIGWQMDEFNDWRIIEDESDMDNEQAIIIRGNVRGIQTSSYQFVVELWVPSEARMIEYVFPPMKTAEWFIDTFRLGSTVELTVTARKIEP